MGHWLEMSQENVEIVRALATAYWRTWLSGWKDLQYEVQDIRDAGDEVVLLIRDQRQWGRHSGIATEFPAAAE